MEKIFLDRKKYNVQPPDVRACENCKNVKFVDDDGNKVRCSCDFSSATWWTGDEHTKHEAERCNNFLFKPRVHFKIKVIGG
ncbi:hypothetical protein M0R19_07730 [Candidatus Pacearchaeota archaeon]|nr:hypothetical protein [Candidatus Pacearchaeota archaeon]